MKRSKIRLFGEGGKGVGGGRGRNISSSWEIETVHLQVHKTLQGCLHKEDLCCGTRTPVLGNYTRWIFSIFCPFLSILPRPPLPSTLPPDLSPPFVRHCYAPFRLCFSLEKKRRKSSKERRCLRLIRRLHRSRREFDKFEKCQRKVSLPTGLPIYSGLYSCFQTMG